MGCRRRRRPQPIHLFHQLAQFPVIIAEHPADILQNLYLKIYKDSAAVCARVEERGSQRVLIRMADHAITEAYRYYFKVDKRDARRERTAAFLKSDEGGNLDLLDWVPSDATSITAIPVRGPKPV